jgi:SNF2 family DNA or RNA helicase
MNFILKPFQHQLDALEKAKQSDCFALYWEPGTGKTKGVIEVIRWHLKQSRKLMRILILAPSATVYNWRDEILKNSKIHNEDIVLLNQKSSKAKAKKMVQWCTQDEELVRPKILITNYETLISEEMYDLFKHWSPEILVCDEVHICKNRQAKRTKRVIKLSEKAKLRYILTGTPILKNVEDIFAQFLILDRGLTFGKNFAVFRQKYMRDANSAFSNSTNYFPKWEAKEETYSELTNLIYRKSMRVLKSECLDLPPFIEQSIDVELSPEQTKLYKEMSKNLLTFIEASDKDGKQNKAVVASIAVVKALRLQQIVSGFCKTDDGTIVEIKQNPRATQCKELLTQLVDDHKVIVWCSFKENYKTVSRICEEIGVEYKLITGDQNAEQKRESEVEFQTNPNVRVMVANRSAGGVGINLTAASYSIVYSRNFSLGEELQSDARNYRSGSQIHDKITKINLVARGTIEEHVIESLQNKREISNRVIDFVKQNLGGL